MVMTNLEIVLNKKTLAQLLPPEIDTPQNVSNEIDPPQYMIEAVIDALKLGKSLGEIKKAVKKTNSKLSLSTNQIKEIERAWKARIAELQAAEPPVEG